MSNPISYSLERLEMNIPKEVMNAIFYGLLADTYQGPRSLDSLILAKVIEPRVMVDCNLLGGTETTIPLETIPAIRYDEYHIVYRIPKSLTNGRSIIKPLSISFGQGSLMMGTNMGMRGASPLLDATSQIFSSQSQIPQISTDRVTLVAENTICIEDNLGLPIHVYLRCKLENDSAFTHIQPESYMAFADMIEYAVKAFIYIKSVIIVDKAQLYGGMELGTFKEIISEYKDAAQNYKDFIATRWKKISLLNDKEAKARHYKTVSGGGW